MSFIVYHGIDFSSPSLGAMNMMIPFTTLAGILTYAWPFAQSKASLVAVTVLYGSVVSSLCCKSFVLWNIKNRFCSGSYVSLLGNPILDMGETNDVGRRFGMFMSILSIGALAGPPISGAISTATGGFRAVGYYAGLAHITNCHLKKICSSIYQEHLSSLVLE